MTELVAGTRIVNRHRYNERTREYYVKGTFLRFDGCLAIIKLDDWDNESHAVPDDYAIESTLKESKTLKLSDFT